MRGPEVPFDESARIWRSRNDIEPIVDVEELGVMVQFFGEEGHTRHEAPGLGEVFEMVALAYRVAVLDFDPAMELVQRRLARRSDQPFDHAILLKSVGVIP